MAQGDLRVETLVTGSFVENGYVLWREGRDDCVVIDPGDEPDTWSAWFEANGLRPVLVLGTHCHLDHVGAVAAIQAEHGCPYRIHVDEQTMLDMLPVQCQMFGFPQPPTPTSVNDIRDGTAIDVAGITLSAIATPGHTPGGTCYHVPDLGPHGTVFTGDSLFAGSIGRTDLPGGDTRQLVQNLHRLLDTLPADCEVRSGHGPKTTIGHEKRSNPFVGTDARART